MGRQRDPNNKNAPRTIDLDISLWDSHQLEYKLAINGSIKSWIVPDEDVIKYAHAVVPVAEISPQFIHPVKQTTLATVAQEITGKTDFQSLFEKVDLKIHLPTSMPRGAVESDPTKLQPSNQVAIVTGGGKRIGAAIVRYLHQMGFNVIVHCNKSLQVALQLVQEFNRSVCVEQSAKTELKVSI